MFLDVPGAPGKPKASDIGATEMTVSWAVPESDGGAPIKGYILERKEVTSTRWVRVNKELHESTILKVTDLREKSEYKFCVMAENKAGVGPASEPSDVYMAKSPYGKPSEVVLHYLYSASLKSFQEELLHCDKIFRLSYG